MTRITRALRILLSQPRRRPAASPTLERLETLALLATNPITNYPGAYLTSTGFLAQAAVFDVQDASIQTYQQGNYDPVKNPTGMKAHYDHVPLGYKGDTITPVTVSVNGTGDVVQAAVFDQQDGAFHIYQAGTRSASNPTGTAPTYNRLPLGYKGDTIVPFNLILDGTGRVVQAVVYDEQDAAIHTYRPGIVSTSNPTGAPTYNRRQIGYKGDTIIPLTVNLDVKGAVFQAVVYDEQDGAIQTFSAGSSSSTSLGSTSDRYTRLPLGYKGDTVVPFSVIISTTGQVAAAAVYDVQDAAVHTYQGATTGPNILGGSSASYGRVSIGYKGDAVIPLDVTIDAVGRLASATVFDVQDAAVHTYKAGSVGGSTILGGTPPSYSRQAIGYRGDSLIPILATTKLNGVVTQAAVFDRQDGTIQTFTATTAGPAYDRVALGYPGDTIIPINSRSIWYALANRPLAPRLF